MKKRLLFITITLCMIFSLFANDERSISGSVTSLNGYEPGTTMILSFQVEFTSDSIDDVDFFEMEFPTGITPISGTSINTESAELNNQKISWGELVGWEGSGSGTMSGTHEVNINVEVSADINAAQIVEYEIVGDDPYTFDSYTGTTTVNQVANGPIITIDKEEVFFGINTINTESIQTFTIENSGSSDLTISNITGVTDQFEILTDYSAAIAADSSLDVEVKFTAATQDLFKTTLIIENNNLNKEIKLQGIGKKNTAIVESFEDNFAPSGWDNIGDAWTQSSSLPNIGEKSAYIDYNRDGILATPKLLIENDDKLCFYAGNRYTQTGNIIVKISTDKTNWIDLSTFDVVQGYKAYSVNISGFSGSYYIGFAKDCEERIILDDVVMPQIDMNGEIPSLVTYNEPENEAINQDLDITLDWYEDIYADGYRLSYGTNADADNIQSDLELSESEYELTNLDFETTYFWKVQPYNDNGEPSNIAIWSFSTKINPIATPPYTEDFTTFVPSFWSKAKGLITDDTYLNTSSWAADGFANNGTTGAARLNIYGDSKEDWLVSKPIDLGNSNEYVLSFDLALTEYGNQNSASLDGDDQFAVVVSTDDGQTWTNENVLRSWGISDDISNTGDNIEISLADYSGVVKIGFYGESTFNDSDVDLHIDNFKVLPAESTPIFNFQPTELTFDETIINTTSTSQVITLNNNGSGSIRIDTITFENSENFTFVGDLGLPIDLTMNNLEVNVSFAPVENGVIATNIQVGTSLGEFLIPVSGTAYTPVIGDVIENPFIADFTNDVYSHTGNTTDFHNDYDLPSLDENDAVYQMTFDNDAEVTISLEGSTINTKLAVYANDVTPSSDNYLHYNDDSASENWSLLEDLELAAGTYFVVVDGTSSGEYQIEINADVQTVDADIDVEPETLDFTEMVVDLSTDYKHILVSNGGETSYTINSIECPSEDFTIRSLEDFPIEITDNSLDIAIQFTPQSAGAKTATITINTSAGNATATITGLALQEGTVYESFEDETYPPAGWVRIDNDADEHNWTTWSGSYARTGNVFTMSNSGSMFGEDYDPDNWLITPKVEVRAGDKLIYYIRPMNPEIYGDSYEIKVSTTGTEIANFSTQIFSENVAPEIWAKREVDLTDYVGQEIYLAFHHFENDEDCYAFAIDDVFLPKLVTDEAPAAVTAIYPEDDNDFINGIAFLEWNRDAVAAGYKIKFGTTNPPTEETDLENKLSFAAAGLEAETTYYWQVIPYNENGDATNCPVWNFTTMDFNEFAIPFLENFNEISGAPFYPQEWTKANALLSAEKTELNAQDFAGWVMDDFGNQDADNNSLTTDFYGDEVKNWIISPEIDLGNDDTINKQIRFDLALTETTTTNPTTLDSDDRFAVIVSTDNGETWKEDQILKQWTSNDIITSIGQNEVIDLNDYSGKVRIAFYAESTVGNRSSKIFIDNVVVGEQATTPVINILPNNAEFPLTQVGQMSNSKTFRVSNVGINSLEVISVTKAGTNADQFTLIDNNSYPVGITTDQISFNVIFNPNASGLQQAEIIVTDADGAHSIPIQGYAYGTEGDTIEDAIAVTFTENLFTHYGDTSDFEDDYTMPYESAPVDSSDVVYEVTFEHDMTVHALVSEIDWDSQLAVYAQGETPGTDNYLYYNDDMEEMSLRRTGDNERRTRGYNSMLSNMKLQAGTYYFVLDGSKKTDWFEAAGSYKLEIWAYDYAAPTSLTATINSDNNAEVSWTAPTIVDGTLTGYVVLRDGYPYTGLISETSYTDTNVAPGFSYTYSVLAMYDEPQGYSFPSNSEIVTYGELSDAVIEESFESYDDFAITMENWKLENVDGANNFAIEGFEFANMAEPYAFIVFNPLSVQPAITHPDIQAKTGSKYLAHFLSENVPNNDWVISRKVNLGTESTLDFFAKTFTNAYGYDHFRVAISTTDDEISSFTYITPEAGEVTPLTWKNYKYDLSDYDNQSVYIAIQVIGEDGFIFMMDDFIVRSNGGTVDNDNEVSTAKTALGMNYPNPFNPTTNISFNLSAASDVKLSIYNIKGQKVKTLVNKQMDEGKHVITWHGKDDSNNTLGSGVYFYKMDTKNFSKVRKMMLLK